MSSTSSHRWLMPRFGGAPPCRESDQGRSAGSGRSLASAFLWVSGTSREAAGGFRGISADGDGAANRFMSAIPRVVQQRPVVAEASHVTRRKLNRRDRDCRKSRDIFGGIMRRPLHPALALRNTLRGALPGRQISGLRDEALRVLHPQPAGNELREERVAQGGESAGFALVLSAPRKQQRDGTRECRDYVIWGQTTGVAATISGRTAG